jgi:aminoglycoside phosphotransferase (APT) family kinase protein
MSTSTATPGLDPVALEEYLDRAVPGTLAGPLTARLVAGGKSNLTYALGDGRTEWVLRRPPLGHVLETAHDMAREYRVMAALEGTDVPVPQMVTLCSDPGVLGAPFYVMSFVDGTVYRTEEQLAEVSPVAAERLADDLVDVLARLHDVDPASVGLGDLGRPDGYLERQVRRWGKQLASSDAPTVTSSARSGGGASSWPARGHGTCPGWTPSAPAWPSRCPSAVAAGSCTATTSWTTSSSRPGTRASSPSSTGRWRRSATR